MPLVFTGNSLDRADARRNDSAWTAARLKDPASKFLVLSGLRPLMATRPALDIHYLDFAAVAEVLDSGAQWLLLGIEKDGEKNGEKDQEGGTAFFALDVTGHEGALPATGSAEAKFIDARSVAMQFGTAERDGGRAGRIALARAVLGWHARHGFCAKCGASTRSARAGFLRACENDACLAEHFPRTDPVVIMLALDGERCLLGRSPDFPEGTYSALAGFMEPGETIEEAVRRELMEEAGIEAGAVRYLASQPWPFPSTLMIGCYAEALTTDINLDGHELEDALWLDKKVVRDILAGSQDGPVLVPTRMAIAATLLRNWVEI
ncbi:MAG: NAD(+) diphosphatase [Proteobacteria bacterium]|nr:NAD(+) diphosphatase [Pseudomonadota bacterium]